jgi:hypothetical protein
VALLRLSAFLAPDDVPISGLIQAAAEELPPELQEALSDGVRLDERSACCGGTRRWSVKPTAFAFTGWYCESFDTRSPSKPSLWCSRPTSLHSRRRMPTAPTQQGAPEQHSGSRELRYDLI